MGAAAADTAASEATPEAVPTTAAAAVAQEQAAPEMPSASTVEVAALEANATEQAKLDLAAVTASALGNLRGTSGWGHGIFGETCCMCSMHSGWNTVLYAAGDYSNFFGSHAANWWCQQQCEVRCHL